MTAARVDLGAGLRAETREIERPRELLDCFGADGFAWFGDETTFVTGGALCRLAPPDVAAFLQSIPHDAPPGFPAVAGPLAVGALGFAGTGRLTVPTRVVGMAADGRAWMTTLDHHETVRPARPEPPTRYDVEAASTRDEWARAVADVLRLIDAGRTRKVVLAREVRVVADAPFDIAAVLAQLRRTQPGCYVFADRGFVGATPELLVRRSGPDVTCRPMAGTVPRGVDAQQLVASRKDGVEHDVVAAAVIDELRRWCDDVVAAPAAPASFADVTHLVTEVRGRLARPSTSALDLARALHPTPAVAGTPRDEAVAAIAQLEPTERGKYAGPVGWVGAHGDGEFAVGLRCAQIDEHVARLHAGAGIVAGSDPDAEWDETSAKLEPMLRALVRP
jgi:menaquinone-specific isochorismate synthase